MRSASEDLRGVQRILLHGVTGSGKSTTAARLAELTGIGWTEADGFAWLPGWVKPADDEQRRRAAEVCAGEEWILDSAWGVWRDLVLPRADLVIGLDYPRWRSLSWLVRRTVARIRDQRPVCNGNVETWRQALSSDSILVWHFRSFRGKRENLREWENDPAAPRVLRFRRPRDLERWLST